MSAPSPATMKAAPAGPPAPASSLFLSAEKRTLPLALLLVAIVVVAYSPITHNGFINFDDGDYVTDNPHVKSGLNLSTMKWAFTTMEASHYHPLTWLSHALDCQLFGLDPSAHHEVTVLIHAANVVLLFLLLQTITGFQWRSLFVAALFALHPINVESIAWASERKNVLSMLFLLLTLHAYIAYVRRPGLGRYTLVALSFALGLLSKSQIITLPCLLLLLDYWPLYRFNPFGSDRDASVAHSSSATSAPSPKSIRWLIVEKLLLFALAAACAVVTMKAQKAGGAVETLSVSGPLLRVETALISYAHYLGKAVWPANFVLVNPQPMQLYPTWQVAAAALLLASITAFVLLAYRRRYLATGWFWFLGALVPMIGLVRVGGQAMPDHFAYLPFIGLFLMLTWLAAEIAKNYRVPATTLAIPACAIPLLLGGLTFHQLGYWRDTPSIWLHTLAGTGDNYIAHDMLANYLFDKGEIEEAAAHYHAALKILPYDMLANLGLGAYEHVHGNLPAALERYRVVALHGAQPQSRATAYGNLGSVYRQLGDSAQAKGCFEKSLEIIPNQPMPMIGLGLIAQKEGNFEEAIRQYSRAMAIQPTDVGYLLIASALEQDGRSAEAQAIVERVNRFSPNLPAAQEKVDSLLGNEFTSSQAGTPQIKNAGKIARVPHNRLPN